MDYTTAINGYRTDGVVGQLRAHLLTKFGQGPVAAPKLFIGANQAMDQAAVAASYNAAGHAITVRHGADATDEDVLDAVLFEVSNVLNPKLAQVDGLPKHEPIDNYGAAKGAAECDTMKAYVTDLATIFANGDPTGFAGLLADDSLPSQARATMATWANIYQPIYANYRVNVQVVPASVPLNQLLPLPAMAPPVPGGAAPAPVPAEQAAIIQFCGTIHNPGATGDQFYLAQLNTRQVYGYERPRGWTANQLTNYLTNIGALANAMGGIPQHQVYRPYRQAWLDADPSYRCYLFARLMTALDAAHPQTIPAECGFDQATEAVAREEAARGVAFRYDSPHIDYKKVLPIKPWLASDQGLLNAVNGLLQQQNSPKVVNLAAIK